MSSSEHSPGPGSRCGPYALVRQIGIGGMGEVYEAVQTSLKRRVAVKLLADWALSNPRHRERFVQEAEIAARMRHPNIVEIHDVGTWGERPYFVMELLEGRSLADELDMRGVLSAPEIAELMLPVMSAVAAAHDRGVVHRDLKPENIFIAELDSGIVPKVLDFGISQIVTRPGKIESYAYGTPQYMAPELISGAGCDERSDQYSLGVVLHELAKGELPGNERSVEEILRRRRQEPYPVADLDGVPAALREVILRATQRDPAHRFADLRDMAVALRQLSTQTPSIHSITRAGDTSRASGTPTQAAPTPRRGRLFGLVAGALLAGGLGLFVAARNQDAPPVQEQAPLARITPPELPDPPATPMEPDEEVVAEAAPEPEYDGVDPATSQAMTSMRRRRPTRMRGAAEMDETADPWRTHALPPEPIGTRMTTLDPWAQ